MALLHLVTALLLALAFAKVEPSSCLVFKGSVSCLDCDTHYDLSGIMVLVKCDKVKKLAIATTEDDGSFKTELPSGTPQSRAPTPTCLAKLVGGTTRLYALKKNMVSQIVEQVHNSYTISTPLAFSTKCPSPKDSAKCGTQNVNTGSSKTVDLPLPPEWGLAPSSYYIPFVPIIGIP